MQCQSVEKQCLHFLPSDPSVRKVWINFVFNEDPDHVSKNLVLCSLHFTTESFKNKAQFDTGFSKIKTKRFCADYIGTDSNVAPHKCEYNCFYYVVTIALSLLTEHLM